MSQTVAQVAKSLGFTGALPNGATAITKNGNGSYTITVGGEDKVYNADGSVFTSDAPVDDNASVPAGNGTVAGGGSDNNSSIFGASVNGGYSYNIDPAILGGAAMNLDAILQLGQQVPYGLGGQFTQGALNQNALEFMNSLGFNFDFSNILAATSGSAAGDTVGGSTVAGGTTGGAAAPGSTTIQDENGESLTVDELAEEEGYKKSAKSGFYKKGGKYYKYDLSQKEFVEATERESQKAKEADDKVAKEKQKAKAVNERKAGTIAADIFDAIDGAGTNDSKLSEAVKSITKDNVIEAFDKWIDKGYEKEFGNEGGLIASIQDDVSGDDQDEYENHIADALYDRAIDLDLVEEAEEFRSDIESIRLTKGRGSSKDKALNEKFNEFVELIKEKEAELAED